MQERGWALALLGGLALFLYGFAATFQTDPHFGRILAAYGGVFVAGSLAWGVVLDGFRPDLIGASVCLVGVAIIIRPALRGRRRGLHLPVEHGKLASAIAVGGQPREDAPARDSAVNGSEAGCPGDAWLECLGPRGCAG